MDFITKCPATHSLVQQIKERIQVNGDLNQLILDQSDLNQNKIKHNQVSQWVQTISPTNHGLNPNHHAIATQTNLHTATTISTQTIDESWNEVSENKASFQSTRYIPQLQTIEANQAEEANVSEKTNNQNVLRDAVTITDHITSIPTSTLEENTKIVCQTYEESESEDELIYAFHDDFNNLYNQLQDTSDTISTLSDSGDEYYLNYDDLDSCYGEVDSSIGNLADFTDAVECICSDQADYSDCLRPSNIIASLQADNPDSDSIDQPTECDKLDQNLSVKSENSYRSDESDNTSNSNNKSERSGHKPHFNIFTVRDIIPTILKAIAVSCLRELTTTTAAVHTINVQRGAVPFKARQRQIPCKYQHELEAMLNDMIEAGIIQKSNSAWASPLRLVKKKDGKLRITIDYQKVNSLTERPAYPIPYISDIFTKLSKSKYYTVVDLTSGYYQVPLDPNSRKYTAFRYGDHQYEYLRMPMGITGAVETFQKMMNEALGDYLHTICEVYLDDIVIHSENLEEHVKHVKMVADRLASYNFQIKLEKCQIALDKIEFLGHTISNGTIQPNQKKVEDLFKYTTPLTEKQIHSFIGLGSYYRKFIPNFASITIPLHEALKQKKIIWTQECEHAVNAIRQYLVQEPVLILPDIQKPFRVDTDASGYGVGAILSQEKEGNWHPVAYFSKALSPCQQRYSTTERELLSIVLAVEHFQIFLYGEKFTVVTDHEPLKHLLKTKEPASRLIRWRWRLSKFDFTIVYRKGIKNGNADALSRFQTIKKQMMFPQMNHSL